MSLIESQAVTINKSDEEIFNFISDFTNFATLMPPQVQDVKITQDSCSFSIQGMPTINLKIYERIPFSSVKMKREMGKYAPKLFSKIIRDIRWFNPLHDWNSYFKGDL